MYSNECPKGRIFYNADQEIAALGDWVHTPALLPTVKKEIQIPATKKLNNKKK